MLEETLKDIGLNEKEAEIFLIVFQYKKILPARISSISKINRSTVYVVGKTLEEKGLIKIDYGNKTRMFVSPKWDEIETNIRKEEEQLKRKQKAIHALLDELKSIPSNSNFSVPKIRFIDQIQLNDFLVKESDKWAQSALAYDATWWGYQDPTLVQQYEFWPDHFWPKYGEKIKMKIFTNKEKSERKMAKKEYSKSRLLKFLDAQQHNFSVTQVVIGEYVLIIMTHESPHYLIEIHDAVIAHNMRETFKLMWEKF